MKFSKRSKIDKFSCKFIFCLIFLKAHLLGFVIGCANHEDAMKGSVESKPQPASLDAVGAGAEAKTLARLSYDFELFSDSGSSICEGIFSARLQSDFELALDDSNAQCAFFNIDISRFLSPINFGKFLSDSEDASDLSLSDKIKLNHDGTLLRLEGVGEELRFDPPRPLMFGPFIQDQDALISFSRSWNTTVTINDEDFQGSGQGIFEAKVISVNSPYDDPRFSSKFKNTIHWQITANGFETILDRYGLLIPHFELWYNSNPIMIPKIRAIIDSKSLVEEFASEIGGGTGSGFISSVIERLGGLIGDVTIEMRIRDYNLIGSN